MSKLLNSSRNIGTLPAHHQATFLELFYDLVYVILISTLAHTFASHISIIGTLKFLLLFVMVWWAWISSTIYFNLHGEDDTRTRLYMMLQMVVIIAMVVFVHEAFEHASFAFALAFSILLSIQTFQWWRTGVADPKHKSLATPTVTVFSLAAILFASSVFVPEEYRHIYWGFGLFVGLGLQPIVLNITLKKDVEAQRQFDKTKHVSELDIERFGLFTIISLGEIFVSVVSGLTSMSHPNFIQYCLGFLGVLVGIIMWVIYFDRVSQKTQANETMIMGWVYFHLPLTITIITTGVAIMLLIEQSNFSDFRVNILLFSSLVIFGLTILGFRNYLAERKN